jgi:hypothetical protein
MEDVRTKGRIMITEECKKEMGRDKKGRIE